MTTKRTIAVAIACLGMSIILAAPAQAQSSPAPFAKLVQRVPDSVNTIILLNAKKIFSSEIALREGWRTNFERAIAAGLTRLPSDTEYYVMASQTDFEYMQPVWQLGVLATAKKHDMSYVAKKDKGKLDTIAGHAAILLPSNNYLVQLDETTYGTLVPASRQAVSRWIKSTDDAKPEFSDYIREAIGYSDEVGTEIILAMDLTDVLDAETVTAAVKESKIVQNSRVNQDAAVKVLVSLRGVMLGITFGERSSGSIKVDFGEDATVLREIGPQLLLEALGKHGAMIDDFAKWTGKVEGKQIRLSGTFSPTGMRQIFSLMDPPTAITLAPSAEAGGDQGTAGSQDSTAVATQKYFAAINQYIRDLRNKEPQRIAQYGIWFDKYARKIDQLPMLNVDDEMLDFGAYIAQQFRNAGSAIQGIGVRKRVRQVANVNAADTPGYWGSNYDGGYYYGGYYYGGPHVVGAAAASRIATFNAAQQAGLRQQQRIRTQVNVEEKARGTSAARAIMKDIDGAVAHMRRVMTKKYKIEF